MVLRTQKNKNNNIQTQLKTIPREQRSFPGGKKIDGNGLIYKGHMAMAVAIRK